MSEESLEKKWLNNELSDSEREVFMKSDNYNLSNKIVENAKQFSASNNYKVDDFETFKNKYNKTQPKQLDWRKPLLKIASVIVISLGIYYTFFNSNLIETQTLASEKTSITLPDNSQVTLNALTKIEYNKKDWDDNRSLKLEGEAFFKVAKGKTFDVITKKGIVTVVGTEFNVKQRANYFEVNCFEGIVKVTSDTIIRQLLAGDSYRILNKQFSENKISTPQPLWTKNTSYFTAVPFKEVLAEVERQYSVEVVFKNINTERLFTGGFTHGNIESALKSITKPMNLTYKLNSSNLVEIHEAKN